jgi:DNA-binding CsgD family transcriptional regulator
MVEPTGSSSNICSSRAENVDVSNYELLVVLTGVSSKFSSLVRSLARLAPGLLVSDPSSPPHPQTKQLQRHLTEDRTLQLVAEYEAGATMRTLALNYGVHRGTVADHLRRSGVTIRPKGLNGAQVDEAVRLYISGWSLVKIAERMGCDGETVRTELKRHGVSMRKPWERS